MIPVRYRGLLYRALNPRWARAPLSGEGARRFGGRFNPVGQPALYLSCAIETAIREANQVGVLQPITLVAYRADLDPLFDATDATALQREGIDGLRLASDTWRQEMRRNGIAETQRVAERLRHAGYAGLKVQSFAPGAGPRDVNICLWRWGPEAPTRLVAIDDDDRLA